MKFFISLFLKAVIFLLGYLSVSGVLSSWQALLAGIVMAFLYEHPWGVYTKKMTSYLLGISIVGMGFGTNLKSVLEVGGAAVGTTLLGIVLTIFLGKGIGWILGVPKKISLLTTVGTAICGGSAIAAVSPVVRAKDHEISVSLGIVFLLNAVALVVFPHIGHYFHLSQEQFGVWAAMAIHDTSSVVGATSQYGDIALQIGTTMKLTRALWIMPVAIWFGATESTEKTSKKRFSFKIPWFIWGFLLASALATGVSGAEVIGSQIAVFSKRLLVLTLFIIGLNLNRKIIASVGFRPFLQGVLLWIMVSCVFLLLILNHWI